MDFTLLRPSRSRALQMARLGGLHAANGSTSICDLPPDVLRAIMRSLSAADLASLSTQNRYMRQLATAAELWQPLCEVRWPRCATKSAYGGNWQRMYHARAIMPGTFPHLIDQLAALQRSAADSGINLSSAFEATMQVLVEVQLLASRSHESIAGSPEQQLLWRSVGWWLQACPEVAIRFVRDTNAAVTELVSDGASRALEIYSQAQMPWRRSAIAFLGGVLRRCESLHPSVREALVTETMKLDRTIRSIMHDPWAAAPAPAGLPDSHWWYPPSLQGLRLAARLGQLVGEASAM